SVDGSLRLWELESNAQIGENWRDENDARVWSMILSPNGKTVASGSEDGKVKVWDVEGSKTVLTIEPRERWVNAVIYSPDATKIATSGDMYAADIWNAKTGDRFKTLRHGMNGVTQTVGAISLSFNDRFLASVSWDKTARLWNLDTNLKIGPSLQHEQDLHCAALSTDGKLLVLVPKTKKCVHMGHTYHPQRSWP
ncbi:WD40 repeat-like protein, partial [Suillus hirtellus]